LTLHKGLCKIEQTIVLFDPESGMSVRKAKPSVTLKAIARQLQVSESTVSRVLSGNGKKYRISA